MGDMADLECDSWGMDGYFDPCLSGEREEEINLGFWRDRKGCLHRIRDMKISHLVNIANMLERLNIQCPPMIALEIEIRNSKGEE